MGIKRTLLGYTLHCLDIQTTIGIERTLLGNTEHCWDGQNICFNVGGFLSFSLFNLFDFSIANTIQTDQNHKETGIIIKKWALLPKHSFKRVTSAHWIKTTFVWTPKGWGMNLANHELTKPLLGSLPAAVVPALRLLLILAGPPKKVSSCQVSSVTCQVSRVKCHVSSVTCQVSVHLPHLRRPLPQQVDLAHPLTTSLHTTALTHLTVGGGGGRGGPAITTLRLDSTTVHTITWILSIGLALVTLTLVIGHN